MRFDHLVVCSGKDLVDLWGGPLLCGPNPTSQYGQGSDNSFCEPGFHAILLGIFKNANYFHVIANVTGRKLDRYYFSSQDRRPIDFVFVLSFL